MRVHDVRHAAATAMLAAGVPLRTVADTLGHSDVRMTLSTYAHTLPELAREAARRMDDYVTRSGTRFDWLSDWLSTRQAKTPPASLEGSLHAQIMVGAERFERSTS